MQPLIPATSLAALLVLAGSARGQEQIRDPEDQPDEERRHERGDRRADDREHDKKDDADDQYGNEHPPRVGGARYG